ncbi:MAG: YheT family hydrolase [Mariniblastus sp.]
MLVADYPPFKPLSFLNSAHLQTVGAYFLRGNQPDYKAVKHAVWLADGDQLVIHDDKPDNWITGDRIAILFHGLAGCHRSPYMVRAADKLTRRGVRVIRVDMRGFGDSTFISRSHIHGGYYKDVFSVVDFVHHLCPISKISLVGFSIGGNIILKALGQWGTEHPKYVDSAVTICPPIDLIHCSWNLRRMGNRVYESYFMKSLKSQLTIRRRHVKDMVDNNVNPLPSRLIHWDDQITGPCWGYDGARDYYADASSAPTLDRVGVPTIILAASDDPVVPHVMFGEFKMSNYIELISTKKGGHLGFISQGVRDPDRHWMDWRICQWVTSQDEDFGLPKESAVPRPYSNRGSRSSSRSSSRTSPRSRY